MPTPVTSCPAGVAVFWRLPSPAEAPGGWALLAAVVVALLVSAPPLFQRQPAGWPRVVVGLGFGVGGALLVVAVVLSVLVGPAFRHDTTQALQSFIAQYLEPGASWQAVYGCALANMQTEQGFALAMDQLIAACFAGALLGGVVCLWLSLHPKQSRTGKV